MNNIVLSSIVAVLCFGSSLSLAAPPHDRNGHAERRVHSEQRQHAQPEQRRKQLPPPSRQQKAAPARHHARQAHSGPPANFSAVRHSIHANRHNIGRGPQLAQRPHYVRGQRLPHGWGHRLSPAQHRHVPRYHGHEWRRVGGDMVLVTLGTGVIIEILQGVLN